ncbi:hypothetical protein KFK09_014641 [Dendrobium nobile]|uniref:Uncharacterized protein n=1 Tax=Dendrobium nobile TaxID=94219 RepID=A0A8T3B4X8_DENNO|nr:hypothetical protein KFK09_014641 [Dendrobium nobile]
MRLGVCDPERNIKLGQICKHLTLFFFHPPILSWYSYLIFVFHSLICMECQLALALARTSLAVVIWAMLNIGIHIMPNCIKKCILMGTKPIFNLFFVILVRLVKKYP